MIPIWTGIPSGRRANAGPPLSPWQRLAKNGPGSDLMQSWLASEKKGRMRRSC